MKQTEAFSKGKIQTVKGLLSKEKLGYCQCHEHLFLSKGESFRLNPALWMDDSEKTIKELEAYRILGGKSIVDAQPGGCGRMAGKLLEASSKSNINIIASTGFHKLCFYPDKHPVRELKTAVLTELFISEIREGMHISDSLDTGIKTDAKAGVIKTALDIDGLEGRYKDLFKAALQASAETGVPILCHIEKGSDFLNALKFFSKNGVLSDNVIACHLDRAVHDINIHKEAAKFGIYLEYDTIARPKYHTDRQEIELIMAMVDAGFEKSILLGLDTNRERLKSYGGSTGLDYILANFIPEMKSSGIPEQTIANLTTVNPGCALAIK